MKDRIVISSADMERLRRICALHAHPSASDYETVQRLEEELDRAEVVDPASLPVGVIGMHSLVRLIDLDTGERLTYRLVFPGERFPGEPCVSILAPIGAALIGYPRGSVIVWRVPKGVRRLKVTGVEARPGEAAARLYRPDGILSV